LSRRGCVVESPGLRRLSFSLPLPRRNLSVSARALFPAAQRPGALLHSSQIVETRPLGTVRAHRAVVVSALPRPGYGSLLCTTTFAPPPAAASSSRSFLPKFHPPAAGGGLRMTWRGVAVRGGRGPAPRAGISDGGWPRLRGTWCVRSGLSAAGIRIVVGRIVGTGACARARWGSSLDLDALAASV
jgi:hypothetical protein